MMPKDYTGRRRELAQKVIERTTQLVDALRGLEQLAADVRAYDGFQPGDFEGVPQFAHLDAADLNTLLESIVPALAAAAEEPAEAEEQGQGGKPPRRRAKLLLTVKGAS
jgi:hypothetical protein